MTQPPLVCLCQVRSRFREAACLTCCNPPYYSCSSRWYSREPAFLHPLPYGSAIHESVSYCHLCICPGSHARIWALRIARSDSLLGDQGNSSSFSQKCSFC